MPACSIPAAEQWDLCGVPSCTKNDLGRANRSQQKKRLREKRWRRRWLPANQNLPRWRGVCDLQPETWSAKCFFQQPVCDESDAIWFLKHRLGVKGQSVYPFNGTDLLVQRLARRREAPFERPGGGTPGSARGCSLSRERACGAGTDRWCV